MYMFWSAPARREEELLTSASRRRRDVSFHCHVLFLRSSGVLAPDGARVHGNEPLDKTFQAEEKHAVLIVPLQVVRDFSSGVCDGGVFRPEW